MASPHAAGAAALVAAVRPGLSAVDIRAALLDGADRLPGLAGISVSGGRLNAAVSARIAAGLPPAPGPDPGPLGPQLREPGETEAQEPVVVAKPAAVAKPRISGVRVTGQPRVCRGRRSCQARTATLSFVLAAEADVTVRLQRRRCVRTRCRWRGAQARTRHVRAGRAHWTVGRRLLGMALRPGRWRVTLVTSESRARRVFRVR
jgi:hypothetical protein